MANVGWGEAVIDGKPWTHALKPAQGWGNCVLSRRHLLMDESNWINQKVYSPPKIDTILKGCIKMKFRQEERKFILNSRFFHNNMYLNDSSLIKSFLSEPLHPDLGNIVHGYLDFCQQCHYNKSSHNICKICLAHTIEYNKYKIQWYINEIQFCKRDKFDVYLDYYFTLKTELQHDNVMIELLLKFG